MTKTDAGPMAFDSDYGQWQDEHQRLINDLRSAVNSHVGDTELQLLLDGVMSHYDEVFRLKSSGAKSDIFHILSGMWKTPAERFLMWLGGFRSSDVLKVIKIVFQSIHSFTISTNFCSSILTIFAISGTRESNRTVNRSTVDGHL